MPAPGVSILKPIDPASRFLGIVWNSSMDVFYFVELSDSKPTEVTKRSILRLTARVFNPYGFVSPVIIQLKLFPKIYVRVRLVGTRINTKRIYIL